ncbi:metal ABC transporter permease [Kineococcus terrestris]|uniref:metal ABC transporter permease n=1 Tax=Kineococcus terrestris TaxID=2044856 RepID=UPI0034DAE37F
MDALSGVFDFSDYGALLSLVRNTLWAGLLLGLVGGLVGVFVVSRDLPFAVHGISELSFAGGAAALLVGVDVVTGSLVGSLLAATLFGVLGARARDHNSAVGVLMPFGLGLGVLFLSLYEGRASNKFGLLTGQVVAVADVQLAALAGIAVVVLAALAVLWRPLLFASLDADVAQARGVPVGLLAPAFTLVLGLAVAMSVQVVGALLVLALLVTPAAAAVRVSSSPVVVPLLSVAFATTSMVGGTLVALGTTIPISPFVTTISFLIYLVCRLVARLRRPADRPAAPAVPSPAPEPATR